MSGRAQVARGVSHHAARRRADRAETVAEKRVLTVTVVPVAEPEQALVTAHVVPAGRLPRADRHQEHHANAARAGGGGPPVDGQAPPRVVPVGRAQRRTVPEPVQVAGRRHPESATRRGRGGRRIWLGSARQRRRV